jgi:hypothetical protein
MAKPEMRDMEVGKYYPMNLDNTAVGPLMEAAKEANAKLREALKVLAAKKLAANGLRVPQGYEMAVSTKFGRATVFAAAPRKASSSPDAI